MKKITALFVALSITFVWCANQQTNIHNYFSLVKSQVYNGDTLLKIYNCARRDSIVVYFTSDTVRSISLYLDKKKDGKQVSYYRNGNMDSYFGFKNGVKDGRFETFYENGNKRSAGTFRNGITTDTLYAWNYNGELIFKEKQ